jgi:Domain of unknown function (DUF4129)
VANGEAHVTRSADAATSLAARSARPIVAGLLLLIVIAGIGAASPAVTGLGPWRHHALALGIGLELVLAGLQVALAVAARRSPTAGHPASALRQALRAVIAVAMVLIVVIAVANLVGSRHGDLVRRLVFGDHKLGRRKQPKLPPGPRPGGALNHASYLLYGLIALIVLAAIAACVIVLLRVRAQVQQPGGYFDEAAEPQGDELRLAVDSGRAALQSVDDVRAAIIACYVAMEHSVASAGTARSAAETPDELLARAAAAGLIRGHAAGRLTGLFYEARFSTHTMAPDARETATQSLDAISAELAGGTGGRRRASESAQEHDL